jgi:hypothetical protein
VLYAFRISAGLTWFVWSEHDAVEAGLRPLLMVCIALTMALSAGRCRKEEQSAEPCLTQYQTLTVLRVKTCMNQRE